MNDYLEELYGVKVRTVVDGKASNWHWWPYDMSSGHNDSVQPLYAPIEDEE